MWIRLLQILFSMEIQYDEGREFVKKLRRGMQISLTALVDLFNIDIVIQGVSIFSLRITFVLKRRKILI